jgi:hypothetical protein
VGIPKERLLTRRAALAMAIAAVPACKKREPAHARIDAALAPMIPADTISAACLRLDRLKDTPFYKTYVEGKKIPQLERFHEETGLDPRTDIWELVFISNGKRNFVMIRGKFGGQFGLEPRIERPGMKRLDYKSYYILFQGDHGVMFLNTGAAIAGKVTDLQGIIDNRDKASEVPPQALLDLVATIPGSAQAWAVTTDGSKMIPQMPLSGNAANLARIAASLTQGRLAVNLSEGIDLEATADYPNAQDAKQIVEALKGFIGIARLSTPDTKPEMLKVYDGIQVNAKNDVVEVRMRAPFELVQTFLQSAMELRGGGGSLLRNRNGVPEVH